MTKPAYENDLRLIEAGFPCHQVGAETQRERDTGKAPPTHRLHVWWARRPLTPSRAAVLASLLPAGTDPDWFLRQLGIEKVQAMVNGVPWTLDERISEMVHTDTTGNEWITVDDKILKAFRKEQEWRLHNLRLIKSLRSESRSNDPVLTRWEKENQPLKEIHIGERLSVVRFAADPHWAKERIEWENQRKLRTNEDKYGYSRAFRVAKCIKHTGENSQIVLDPTAGGGSIPFEALRLGHKVIANEINPVASVILYATLDYPLRFGPGLADDIQRWGNLLRKSMVKKMAEHFPASPLAEQELQELHEHLFGYPEEFIRQYTTEQLDGFLYVRQVTCPHCGGEAPLLNTCWLSKEGEKWGVRVITDGREKGGKVSFAPYRLKGSRGPYGEDPDFATVRDGVGTCVHCRQAIPAEEIKAQARGESPHGAWQDRLYCVVAVRYQPKLDKNGQPLRYKSGEKAGEIKTEKIRFFRAPNEQDLKALAGAEKLLREKWPEWERQGLIPTEGFPNGNDMRPVNYGMSRWCDLFTPRQLLGHLFLVEELNRLKPEIIREHGMERARAIVTYLQFMIDKGLDYNSRQTRWIPQRAIVSGTFGRHDFSLKWTFGEMIFTGPNSGAAWALSQVVDAYAGIAELVAPLHASLAGSPPPVTISCGTAARLEVADGSVDLVCIDPPYYNNVQYAELSDYFYVWQKRTLHDLYPDMFIRRLTNKVDEAVANPARDGSAVKASREYERLMGEIFAECRRVLKDDGIMTVMFTHKTQEAWEALTRSLIENGWVITSTFPVESEFANSQHIMENASAASSIFFSCRKKSNIDTVSSAWSGFGGTGVVQRVREAVQEGLKEFEALRLNPVDEMVAGYGRALKVLSEHWPVVDGDEPVSPVRAMNEASAVVAQHQIARLTQGRLTVADLNPEAAMALILFGIFRTGYFAYDQALNLSRSFNIELEAKPRGYAIEGRIIGINSETTGRRGTGRQSQGSEKLEDVGYFAPLVRKGSKLRVVLPEERNRKRLERPLTEWDMLQGLIMAYREGDIPVARAYLEKQAAGREQAVIDLLSVWASEITEEKARREAQAILFGL